MAASTAGQGLATEDALSFSTAIVGALGSTLQQQNNPKSLLLGLVLASFAKALPSLYQSLSDPTMKQDRWEDFALFAASFLGLLGAGIQTNFSFSTPLSQEILIFGLAAGLFGKAVLSLKGNWRNSLEDWIPLIAAVASAIAVVPLGTQYAEVGIFFGFLGKQLIGSPSTPSQQPTATHSN